MPMTQTPSQPMQPPRETGDVAPTAERISRAAWLLSDPLRASLLLALTEGPRSVSELTAQLSALQPRVSSHLAILRRAGWVEVLSEGRQRRYRLASPRIAELTRALASAGGEDNRPTTPSRARDGSRGARITGPIREARTCYDHLAGVAGVALCATLLERGWIEPVKGCTGSFQPDYALTDAGRAALTARGVEIPPQKARQRRFAYACPDWTERSPHLAGALGAAILRRLENAGIVTRSDSTRAVTLSGDLAAWLD